MYSTAFPEKGTYWYRKFVEEAFKQRKFKPIEIIWYENNVQSRR